MNKAILIILCILGCSPLQGQQLKSSSSELRNMYGISVNNLIWSNNKGLVLNTELGISKRSTLKLGAGYLFWPSYSFAFIDNFPEHLNPNIKKFSGFQILSEYKLYNKKLLTQDIRNRYISAYYQYQHFHAQGDMIVSSSHNETFLYQAFDNKKTEIINELGLKYGQLKTLRVFNTHTLLLDIYIGLGYQFVRATNQSEADKLDPRANIFTTRKLKNAFLDESYAYFPNKYFYNTPVIKFGIDLNLAY